ncbi:MAG: UDP-N-acetyl-D-glucosamine dehydrogenase, partial [candidate division Zixibacteria bacterium]|nr:UDP-N-acetyl-D-glucosamine dehydrogenase [candidate division Zixibacteria bacterium]
MENYQEELQQKFQNRSAKIAILGLGYVGLPLATLFAESGFEVTGVEPNLSKIETLNRGESYVQDVPSHKVKELIQSGKLKPTGDFSVIKDADAVSICVPTPLRKTGDPD